MSFDLSPLLEGWNFQPGQVSVRQITGLDGKAKLQMRLDLGLLQMELDGRPDGQRPYGHDSLFEYYQLLAENFANEHTETIRFTLNADDCSKLQQEAIQYYHRYLGLFQIEDWPRVIRDTERNLSLFSFVEEHAENEQLSWVFQQFRPYVLMMRTRAKTRLLLDRKSLREAIAQIQEGLNAIKSFFENAHHAELINISPEIQFLENWLAELENNQPLSQRDQLEKDLASAIAQEDYEKAAFLRDSLRRLIE